MENITLMQVDGNVSFKLSTIHLGKVLRCDFNKLIQHVQKLLVGFAHYLLVLSSILQTNFSISSPDKLNSQNSHLQYT